MFSLDDHQHDLSGKGILLIDPNQALLRLHESAFAQAGCRVYTATDGRTGLRQFYARQPDLVILELQLPYLDGWELCSRMRQLSDLPLIILTQFNGCDNVFRCLDEGAADYLVKPVEVNELLARTRARLRRVALPELDALSFYRDGDLTLDLDQHRVLVQNQPLSLTPVEYKLLVYLYRYADQLRPHYQILADVWRIQEPHSADVVHKNIRRLRQKLEADPRQPPAIPNMTQCRGEAGRKAACFAREYHTDLPHPYQTYPNLELLAASLPLDPPRLWVSLQEISPRLTRTNQSCPPSVETYGYGY